MRPNYKFSLSEVPSRHPPSNKVKGATRYVLIRGDYIAFPKLYHYHQYLVMVLLPVVLGTQILTDRNDISSFHKLIINHVEKFAFGPQYMPVKASNADTYLILIATDIELLFVNNLLNKDILKRLKSQSDNEMRGVIYEIALAAACVRSDYKLKWLKGDSLPEFTAKRDVVIDVEAKRRNRQGQSTYNLEKEIRAIRTRLAQALKKKRKNKYLIFIDSDIPPKTSKENEKFYARCELEFKDYNLTDTAVVITNSGYEHTADSDDTGKNSIMVFQGNNSPSKEVIEEIILSMHAKIPDAVSDDWPVA